MVKRRERDDELAVAGQRHLEVAVGLRDAIRSILNHSFSPHLASTGIHCLVAEVPLALRNHIFVPASFGDALTYDKLHI